MKVVIILLVALVLPLRACCEENVEKIIGGLDLAALEEAAGEEMDVRSILLGLATGEAGLETEAAFEKAKEIFLDQWREMFELLPVLLLPAIVSAVMQRTLGNEKSSAAAQYICYLACALSQTGLLAALIREAEALAERVAGLTDAAFPLLVSLLSASGATAAAAMLTPMAALLGRLTISLLGGAGLKACSLAAATAIAGNLSGKIGLKNLFGLIVSAVNWTIGLVMTGFVGLLSIQGLLGNGYDSTSVRAARYAVDNLLPVIGGEVADTMDALVSSILLVKNAAGVTGMLILLGICAQPILRFAAALFSLKLSAAALEPLAENGLTRLTEQIAKVVEMLLTIAAACVVLAVLLLGATLTAGRSVVR